MILRIMRFLNECYCTYYLFHIYADCILLRKKRPDFSVVFTLPCTNGFDADRCDQY